MKIQIINECAECEKHRYPDWLNAGLCLREGKLIWSKEIPEWCPLEDAKEITGIPCSHVAPEGVCERCGEEVKDRCIGKE